MDYKFYKDLHSDAEKRGFRVSYCTDLPKSGAKVMCKLSKITNYRLDQYDKLTEAQLLVTHHVRCTNSSLTDAKAIATRIAHLGLNPIVTRYGFLITKAPTNYTYMIEDCAMSRDSSWVSINIATYFKEGDFKLDDVVEAFSDLRIQVFLPYYRLHQILSTLSNDVTFETSLFSNIDAGVEFNGDSSLFAEYFDQIAGIDVPYSRMKHCFSYKTDVLSLTAGEFEKIKEAMIYAKIAGANVKIKVVFPYIDNNRENAAIIKRLMLLGRYV